MTIWRVCKEAGRPWPVMSDDDYIDWCIMEAVQARVQHAEVEAAKARERAEWRKGTPGSG